MSALKNNPFLIGFGAIMVVGVGALGYLAYSAADSNSQARQEFEETSNELKRLQTLRPFPSAEHLKAFQAQKDELQVKVDALQKSLAEAKIKIEDISPTGFQDKLRDSVARVTARAPQSNVLLPDKFYMGFPMYQAQPPLGKAAPVLYRELKAIEVVVNLIMDVKNVQLKELNREELKEERDAKPAPTDNKKKSKAEDDGKKLIERESFTLKFSTTQENFQRILNGVVTNKEQFFVPRYLVVANEKQDAPPKVAAIPVIPAQNTTLAENSATPGATNPPGTPGATPAPAAPAAPEGPKLEYIFGKELVEVTMEIELVDVQEPAAADSKEHKSRK